MQPFSKGGYIGGVSQTMATVMLWALAHRPGLGACSPRKFWNLSRPFEGDSEAF